MRQVVGGDVGDRVAQFPQSQAVIEHEQGSGIAFRIQKLVLDHQNPSQRSPVFRPFEALTRGLMLLKPRLPLLQEAHLVGDLIGLHATGEIGAAGDAFMVDRLGGRLVDHLQAAIPQRQRQVRVFRSRPG